MASSLPWVLILAWAVFFGFVATHQRHAGNFKGSSQIFLLALNLSAVLGFGTAIGLLIYYFVRVAWYWPIILFVVGSLLAGAIASILHRALGSLTVSLLAFVGWPAAAVWVAFIVRGLHP